VRAELHNRRKGDAVRLEIEAAADQEIIDRLRTNFDLDPWQVFLWTVPSTCHACSRSMARQTALS